MAESCAPDFPDPNFVACATAEAQRIAKIDELDDILDWIEVIQKDAWESDYPT